MSGLKDKLNEMNYDMVTIIDPNSLKKVTGGTSTSEEPICKERAATGDNS